MRSTIPAQPSTAAAGVQAQPSVSTVGTQMFLPQRRHRETQTLPPPPPPPPPPPGMSVATQTLPPPPPHPTLTLAATTQTLAGPQTTSTEVQTMPAVPPRNVRFNLPPPSVTRAATMPIARGARGTTMPMDISAPAPFVQQQPQTVHTLPSPPTPPAILMSSPPQQQQQQQQQQPQTLASTVHSALRHVLPSVVQRPLAAAAAAATATSRPRCPKTCFPSIGGSFSSHSISSKVRSSSSSSSSTRSTCSTSNLSTCTCN